MRGLDVYDLPTGATYLKLHHYADPAKNDAWLEQIQAEMADTPDDFRREILMDDSVAGGQPVYSGYVDDEHCPEMLGKFKPRTAGIPVLKDCLFFGLWDAGMALTPAFCLVQVSLDPILVAVIHERTSGGDESMDEFAPRVWDLLISRIGEDRVNDVRHYGDETIWTRNGANKKSAGEIAQGYGMHITGVSNEWHNRHSSVSWLLSLRHSGGRRFIVDGKHCPVLRKGFQGFYKYRVSSAGDSSGPGAIILSPLKNSFSHIHDALQYGAIQIRALIEGSDQITTFSRLRNARG